MNHIISVDEFFDLYNYDQYELSEYIDLFVKELSYNLRLKMIEKMDNSSTSYDIKAECDKFIEMLISKSNKTKEELAKML